MTIDNAITVDKKNISVEYDGKNAVEYLRLIFAKAAKLNGEYMTKDEQLGYLSSHGAEKFKMKTLGLFGHDTLKSLDDIALVLVDIGVASEFEDAKKLIPTIAQASMSNPYALPRLNTKFLSLKQVENAHGQIKYRVSTYGRNYSSNRS